MNTEHEQNLRDLAAMFAMAGLLVKVRAPQEGGIADILNKWGDQS